MDFEKKINELNRYNVCFELKMGYYHVSITYNNGWNVLSPDNDNIHVEERNGVWHYITPVNSDNLDNVFKAIDSTIDYNLDLEKKLELFRKKTAELQEIFSNESLETLNTLEFVMTRKPPKKKPGRKPKNKEVQQVQEEIVGNQNDNTIMEEDSIPVIYDD